MNEVPARASAVVIGAGIVGNSLVHHLALLGWRDVVPPAARARCLIPAGLPACVELDLSYRVLQDDVRADQGLHQQYKALGVFQKAAASR